VKYMSVNKASAYSTCRFLYLKSQSFDLNIFLYSSGVQSPMRLADQYAPMAELVIKNRVRLRVLMQMISSWVASPWLVSDKQQISIVKTFSKCTFS